MALPNLRGFWANQIYTSTWYDQSCRAAPNNLTLTGAADPTDIGIATEWPGALAPYIALDGTNDYASIADNTDLSITTDITMGAWVCPQALKQQGIINKFLATGDKRSYQLFMNTNYQFSIAVSRLGTLATTTSNAVTTVTAEVGQWYFVAGKFIISTSLTTWVNDTRSSIATGVFGLFDNDRPFIIGERNETAAQRWNGYIAQAWICATGVSDDMINWLYTTQAPLFGRA
jgi:hypothetical protein